MRKALMVASVSSMIDQFNTGNIKLLQKMGYEVHVACNFSVGSTTPDSRNIQFQKELDNMNVKFWQIDFSRNAYGLYKHLTAYQQLKIIMKNNEYNLIHFHSPIGGALGRLAARTSRKKGANIIYTAHGFHFYKGSSLINWFFYYPIEKWLSRYTDTLITINEEDYERASTFKKTNTVYVPGVGIETKELENIKKDRNQKRNELNIPTEAFVITSTGELNKNKNHKVIIKAITKLKNDNIHYIICGQGPLKKDLKKLTESLEIEEQIHFMGFRNDINEILHISDLFAFPSQREGLSLSLMEAMAAGLPIIASDIRGNRDLIDYKGGYLLAPGDINGFSEKINKVYTTPTKKIKSMCRYNQKKIKRHSLKNVLNEMNKIYTENTI